MSDEPDESDIPTPAGSTTAKPTTTLSDAGIYHFSGDVSGSSVKPVIEWILTENLKRRHQRLTLIVTSYGGEVYSCFSLIDVMLGSAIPVDTISLGYVASAGLLIAMHGVKRSMTTNTYVMSHQYSGVTWGKQHELIAQRKNDDWLTTRFIEMYVKRSKLTAEEIKVKLLGPSDTFLTAAEALQYGLVDEIKDFTT